MKAAEKKADVVIIGGGGAGLPAAVAAAESGLKVIVLEKRGKPGGNAAMAWGIFASESPVQKQEMAGARNEHLFKQFMDWARWKIDPHIIRSYIWKSGDTIRWLEEKGLDFQLIRYYPGQEPAVWHIPEGRGAGLVNTLVNECHKLGVEILLNTAGRKLCLDDGGKVAGLYAESDGVEISIEARSVIIASGGYGGNPDLLKKYCPLHDESINCFGLPHAGDGISLAMDAGAAPANLGTLLLEWPHVHGDRASLLSTLAREPIAVYVNSEGRRFIDEEKGLHAFECANAVLRQPDKRGYIILDDAMVQQIERYGAVLGRGNDRAEKRRSIPGLKEQLNSMAKAGNPGLVIADSLEKIAGWTGADAGVLAGTVSDYNAGCEQGYDEAFFKDRRYLQPLTTAPYYGIKGDLVFLQTMGGIMVNHYMEVLNAQGVPLQGLYAAGADTGGWEPDTYWDRFSGTAFGFAVNSGRIAAENAARYCESQSGAVRE